MAKSKEYELAIKIAGQIEKSFYNSTKLTKKELSEIAKSAATSSTSMRESITGSLKDAEPAFNGLEKAASTTFKAIVGAAATAGAAITAGLVSSIKTGSEFESAFAGVRKTVDATEAEFSQIRDEIRQMSKVMPTSAAGLAEIAESAGQLGIQTQNITEFAETMAKLEVATDMASTEGAEQFAKFANITGMAQENFDRLGSSVVALGNNMATSEAPIVEMGMRLAAAGDQVGLSQAQIMGYSAALSSVGIEAEAGGSAFSKMLVNMQLAAETGSDLKNYAKVAGMTGKEFKKAFQEDATKAINAFLTGLNNTERNGKSAIAVLEDMGIKEVRLRDTLLRAANASDLFDNALGLSSKAWEENIALANEAAVRYATFESQVSMMGNKVDDMKITAYDSMKSGLTDVISMANEVLDSIAQSGVIEDMIGGMVKQMPTFVREAKAAGKAIGEFTEPFLKVGGWLIDNPGIIVGTIASIGTALATYKIATGISSIASAMSAMGPAGWTIMGIGAAVGIIAGIGTAVKKSAAEAKKANLDKHFGNISLSMRELKEAASFVVRSKELDKIRESIAALGELDGISDTISTATEALNKMNWKISVGMELTAEEKQQYQDEMQSFIKSTQDYVEQKQYAVTLSINTLLGDDLESSNIVTQVNQFYADKQQELANAGTELNKAITDAFLDGFLDPDEAKEIAELKEKLARIQAAVAGSDFEAGLDLIGMKYGGENLDADSFKNLQAEIQAQKDEAMLAYEEAYKTSMSQFRLMRSEGAISQKEYDNATKEVNAGYLQQKTDLEAKSIQFQLDIIKDTYGEEFNDLARLLETEANNQLKESLDSVAYYGSPNVHLDWLGEGISDEIKNSMDKSTRDALKDLYEPVKSALEELQEIEKQYQSVGKEVPDTLKSVLKDTATLGSLAGDMDAVWEIIGQTAESEEYQDAIDTIKESGNYIPEQIAGAIADGQVKIGEAIAQSYIDTQDTLNKVFGVSFDIPTIKIGNTSYKSYGKSEKLDGHADGGIFSTMHKAWVCEKGMESIIPIDGSQNAIDLWTKTGELLGMDETGSKQSIPSGSKSVSNHESADRENKIEYSPTLNFYGSAPPKEEIEDILEREREKFAQMMELYRKDNERFSFS